VVYFYHAEQEWMAREVSGELGARGNGCPGPRSVRVFEAHGSTQAGLALLDAAEREAYVPGLVQDREMHCCTRVRSPKTLFTPFPPALHGENRVAASLVVA
jgi:hypothetical protein